MTGCGARHSERDLQVSPTPARFFSGRFQPSSSGGADRLSCLPAYNKLKLHRSTKRCYLCYPALAANYAPFYAAANSKICGESLRRKGGGTIVARTLFGKIPVNSPRFYRCACSVVGASSRTSFSPLAELLPERTLPELQYLQVKWAASMSYSLTLEILRDVFPSAMHSAKKAFATTSHASLVVWTRNSAMNQPPPFTTRLLLWKLRL